jgi:uncharacterized LabA/DUF88 family protein
MYTNDVIQIVDAYQRYHEGHKQTRKIDPDAEAQSLSMLVMPLGRDARKIAIVAKEDERRLSAYQRAGYETHTMNGNRPTELKQFMKRMATQIKQAKPKHTVLVSDDPDFFYLCEAVAPITELAVWANSATVPEELKESDYGFRPLEELLPNLKILMIDVRIDLENIFIGLVQRGWKPDFREMKEGIRQSLADIGEISTITGYADFDELNRHHGGPRANWQRELTLAGVESRYMVNQHGKNTADMKIADDIRTLVEYNPGTGGMIDIICLATMDRDFRHTIETARSRGKKIIVLALKGGLSRELENVVGKGNVYYLDDHLKFPQANTSGAGGTAAPQAEDVALMLRVGASMHRNRWRRVYRDWLEKEFGEEVERLQKLVTNGWLTPIPGGPVDVQGHARALEPNPDHVTARAAHYLARWIPTRVEHCLNQRGMQYVDSNYIASGMARDTILTRMGVGQTRTAAENWLHAAASAGLVAAEEIVHPQNPSKVITTWRLLATEATPAQQLVEVTLEQEQTADGTPAMEQPTGTAPLANQPAELGEVISFPASSHLRQLLTQGLNDGELTRLLFDHFRPVHREVEGAPKFARIQALLDYVERCKQHELLLTAIKEVNPAALVEEAEPLALAA